MVIGHYLIHFGFSHGYLNSGYDIRNENRSILQRDQKQVVGLGHSLCG